MKDTVNWEEASIEGQIDLLLYDLSIERGINICRKDAQKILQARPMDAQQFAELVVEAEGSTPACSRNLDGIKRRFTSMFGKAAVLH